MLNNIYYSTDNIINGISINTDLNDIFECANITQTISLDATTFNMSYRSIYPTLFDSTIEPSENVIINSY